MEGSLLSRETRGNRAAELEKPNHRRALAFADHAFDGFYLAAAVHFG